VIKLAADALAKRTKDIRLAGWLIESLLLVDGFPNLVPGIELLKSLQEAFWMRSTRQLRKATILS